MAAKSGFFNYQPYEDGDPINNANTYQDVDFARMLSLFVGQSGYVLNYLDELKVVAGDTDRSVKILPGAAWLGEVPGWWYVDNEINADSQFVYTNPGAGVSEDYCIILKLQREGEFKIEAVSVDYPVTGISKNLMEYYLPLAKVTISGDNAIAQIEDLRVPCIRSSSGLETKSESWTLSLKDINKLILCNNTAAIFIDVPSDAEIEFPINTEVVICQYGTSTVTARPKTGSGVVIRALEGSLKSDGQYSAFTLRKIGQNEWLAVGALTS